AGGGARSGYGLRLDFVGRQGEAARRRRLECYAYLADQPGGKREPIRDWTTRDLAPQGAAASLADDLAGLLKEKETSYQRILWKATHLVERATLDRELKVVEQELNGRGLKQIGRPARQHGTTLEYLVA